MNNVPIWNQGEGDAAASVDALKQQSVDQERFRKMEAAQREHFEQISAQTAGRFLGGVSGAFGGLAINRPITDTAIGKRYVDRRPSPCSFIEVHEIDEAIKVVNAAWLDASKGAPLKFRVAGPKLLVKLHVRDTELKTITTVDGDKVKFLLPDSVRAEDKFHSASGLVIDIGTTAYTGTLRDGSERFPDGPLCRRGDFVVLDRYGGKRVTINGVACMIIYDENIDGPIEDPSDIESGHSEHRI